MTKSASLELERSSHKQVHDASGLDTRQVVDTRESEDEDQDDYIEHSMEMATDDDDDDDDIDVAGEVFDEGDTTEVSIQVGRGEDTSLPDNSFIDPIDQEGLDLNTDCTPELQQTPTKQSLDSSHDPFLEDFGGLHGYPRLQQDLANEPATRPLHTPAAKEICATQSSPVAPANSGKKRRSTQARHSAHSDLPAIPEFLQRGRVKRRPNNGVGTASSPKKRRKVSNNPDESEEVVVISDTEDSPSPEALQAARNDAHINLEGEGWLQGDTIERLLVAAADRHTYIAEGDLPPTHSKLKRHDRTITKVIIPHNACAHWVCAVVDNEAEKISIINSTKSLNKMYRALVERAKIWGTWAFGNGSEQSMQWSIEELPCPQQPNGYDWYVVACVWFTLSGEPMPVSLNGSFWRQALRHVVGHDSIDKQSTALDQTELADPQDGSIQVLQQALHEPETLLRLLQRWLEAFHKLELEMAGCEDTLKDLDEQEVKTTALLPQGHPVAETLIKQNEPVRKVATQTIAEVGSLLTSKKTLVFFDDPAVAQKTIQYLVYTIQDTKNSLRQQASVFIKNRCADLRNLDQQSMQYREEKASLQARYMAVEQEEARINAAMKEKHDDIERMAALLQ
jgi:prefoldin subunit 5